MNVGELFISIGVKGADKASGALVNVRTQMADVASVSLEAKAAIVGVLYALERVASQSLGVGTALTQFNNLTGLSGDQLQRWQYLAMKSGESADEMANSILAVQNAMTQMMLNKGAPSGMTAFARSGIDFDIKNIRDTYYVMDKLREYARKTKDTPDVANDILRSFGLSNNTIQALRTSTVDLSKVSSKYLYSKGQTKALNSDNIALKQLESEWSHFLGKLTVEHGGNAIDKITQFSIAVMQLVTALDHLGNSLHIFDALGDAADVGTGFTKYLAQLVRPSSEGIAHLKKLESADVAKRRAEFLQMHPNYRAGAGSASRNTTVNVNTTVHGTVDHHELSNQITKKVKQALDTEVNNATRQIPLGGH